VAFPILETKKEKIANFNLILREETNEKYTKIYLIPSTHISLKKSKVTDLNNHFWGTPFLIVKKDGTKELYFRINHEGHDLLHVHNDNFSLFVKADSIFYKFKSVKLASEEKVFIYQCFQKHALNINIEQIFYLFSKAEMERILFADYLYFRIKGNGSEFESVIPEETKRYWREFYTNFIK